MTSPTPTYGSQVQGGGIAVFDPNTGKALAGAGTYNPNNGLKIQQTPINANIIGNTMPIEIPQVNNTQAQTALGITANAAAQPENNPITEPQPVQESGSQSISQKIQELIGFQGTQGAATAQLQNEQGLTQKQQAVNDINTKITTTKKAYEDQIKEIRKNSEGKFAGAVEQDINNLTRVANEDLANLAIIQASANGNLQTAQEIVDTKIKAEFEPIQNQIASYTQLYNLVQNDLTESEKLAVQDQINTKNNDMQALLGAKKQAYDTALQNGAPANVLKSIGEATTPDMAYQAVGQYGVNKLDNQYKQAQIANIYNSIQQDQIAAQEKLTQLPSAVQTKVQTVASQFDGEQAVKNYQTSAEAVDAVKNAGNTSTDDQARIYAFAKVMDPNSVVRESEYDTVQKYSQAVLTHAGIKAKRIFDNSGLLTPEARKLMLDTLNNRLASSKKAYDNIYNSYASRINKVTGKADGKDYITDYSAAFNQDTPSTPSLPKNGDTKDWNGVTYKVVNGVWTPQ